MEAFTALADPVRAEIVQLLSARDLSAGDIASRFPISRPAVSRHLSVLRRSRLVQVRGEAQRRVYSLDTDGLDEVDRWIGQCRQAWNARLDALGRHLDAVASGQIADWEGNDG
jgi:DNA-binding transcriptional ArsR family regulator